MNDFKVGDKVTVTRCYEGVLAISTVTVVGRLKMTLADGSEWNIRRGTRWGVDGFTAESIRHWKDGDDALLKRRLDTAVVKLFAQWDRLTNEQLSQIAGICREYYAQVEANKGTVR